MLIIKLYFNSVIYVAVTDYDVYDSISIKVA